MNKAWQDDAWEDYLYWQTQDFTIFLSLPDFPNLF